MLGESHPSNSGIVGVDRIKKHWLVDHGERAVAHSTWPSSVWNENNADIECARKQIWQIDSDETVGGGGGGFLFRFMSC